MNILSNQQFYKGLINVGATIALLISLLFIIPFSFAYDTGGYKILEKNQTVDQKTNINNSRLSSSSDNNPERICICGPDSCEPAGCDEPGEPDDGEEPICICGPDSCKPAGCDEPGEPDDGEEPICICGPDSCKPAGCDGSSSRTTRPLGTNKLPESLINNPTLTQPELTQPELTQPGRMINPDIQINDKTIKGDQFNR